jgi:S-adenosylmethionine:tRNA ribosyltransferase-isomerase
MTAATVPRHGPRDRRMLVIDEGGLIRHHLARDFPALLRRGDLVIANDAATIPASLRGVHVPTGRAVEVRLAGRRSLAADAIQRVTAVMFGAGDYRTPTELRELPPALYVGDPLLVASLRATVVGILGHHRLVEIEFAHAAGEIWQAIARHGRPIQYAYVPDPLSIWDTWTSIASTPVAFEAPSAGFILDWAMLSAIRTRGARFATITHAAGVSSTGDTALDRMLPLDEPYFIPRPTAALIRQTMKRGGRIIAVGTTVVRTLEDAARLPGWVLPGNGIASQRVTPRSRLRIVDAVVSGLHECGSSHYELLGAFQGDGALQQMTAEAEARGYLAHEFGDAVFVARPALSSRGTPASGGSAAGRRPDTWRPSAHRAARSPAG